MLQPTELLQSMFPIVTVNILSGKIQKADYIRVKKQYYHSKNAQFFRAESLFKPYWGELKYKVHSKERLMLILF